MIRASKRAVNRDPGSARHLRLQDLVVRAANSRHLGDQDRPVLARVEMSPTTLPRVVPRANPAALGARQLRLLVRDEHPNLLHPVLSVQLHVYDPPRIAQPRIFPYSPVSRIPEDYPPEAAGFHPKAGSAGNARKATSSTTQFGALVGPIGGRGGAPDALSRIGVRVPQHLARPTHWA